MFLGKFITSFSGKNRIVLPKKFRLELQNNTIFVIKGFDGGIWGFDQSVWDIEAQKRLNRDLTTAAGRTDRRDFFANADSLNLDDQGRFILSEEMVKESNLKNQIIIVGCGDHFEIWDVNDWSKNR